MSVERESQTTCVPGSMALCCLNLIFHHEMESLRRSAINHMSNPAGTRSRSCPQQPRSGRTGPRYLPSCPTQKGRFGRQALFLTGTFRFTIPGKTAMNALSSHIKIKIMFMIISI